MRLLKNKRILSLNNAFSRQQFLSEFCREQLESTVENTMFKVFVLKKVQECYFQVRLIYDKDVFKNLNSYNHSQVQLINRIMASAEAMAKGLDEAIAEQTSKLDSMLGFQL